MLVLQTPALPSAHTPGISMIKNKARDGEKEFPLIPEDKVQLRRGLERALLQEAETMHWLRP